MLKSRKTILLTIAVIEPHNFVILQNAVLRDIQGQGIQTLTLYHHHCHHHNYLLSGVGFISAEKVRFASSRNCRKTHSGRKSGMFLDGFVLSMCLIRQKGL